MKHALFLSLAVLALAYAAHAATVGEVINHAGCSTAAVAGLSKQLVTATNCLRSNLFYNLHGLHRVTLGTAAAAVPYLQYAAANALNCATNKRGMNVTVNSALRTLPQQLALYKWFEAKKCGITAAAKPGTSNHEGGLAVDINNADAWISAMEGCHWKKLGSFDPPHYDYVGSGAVDIKKLSVIAFQKLWNVNNPNDKIAEDGLYGPATESRILKSPAQGFSREIC